MADPTLADKCCPFCASVVHENDRHMIVEARAASATLIRLAAEPSDAEVEAAGDAMAARRREMLHEPARGDHVHDNELARAALRAARRVQVGWE